MLFMLQLDPMSQHCFQPNSSSALHFYMAEIVNTIPVWYRLPRLASAYDTVTVIEVLMGVKLRQDWEENIHLLCKIHEGHPKTNKNTLDCLTTPSLGKFQQIACGQSKCTLFDTKLTCFERVAILKNKAGGAGEVCIRPTDKYNRQFCDCAVRQQGRSVFI